MSQQSTRRIKPITDRGAAFLGRPQRNKNRALTFLLALVVWVVIIIATVDFKFLFARPTADAQLLNVAQMAPDVTIRAVKILLIIFGALVIFTHPREAYALVRRINRFFLLFAGLALVSVMWSVDRHATADRCVSFTATALISFAFCLACWHRARFQNVVRAVVTVVLIGSLIYIILAPDLAIDLNRAGYHGLSIQKNPFGEVAAIGTLLWMHNLICREGKLWRAVAGALIGWACLFLSRSSTSILATVFATFFLILLLRTPRSMRRYTPYITAIFAILVTLYALAILNLLPAFNTIILRPIIALSGKDVTFSDRTAIWNIVEAHASLHPILGTGYGAYWTGAFPGSASYAVISQLYYWPSESHNGYLEMYNDLGLVGLTCLLGYLAMYLRQALQLFKFDRWQAALYLGLFFQQALTNLSESCWFSANGVVPVAIVTLATCALGRGLLERRQAMNPTRTQAYRRIRHGTA